MITPEELWQGIGGGEVVVPEEECVVIDPHSEVAVPEPADLPSVEDILGSYDSILSLDLSKDSTGVFIWKDGEVISDNLSALDDFRSHPHEEAVARRQLKNKILNFATPYGTHYNVIIVEDAFVGRSHTVARMLYSLNSSIDELILDGDLTCDRFIRSNNKTWKSRLSAIVGKELVQKVPDKIKVQACMGYLGIHDTSTGFQDRLDAFGMALGEIHHLEHGDPESRKITWSKVSVDVFDSFEDMRDNFPIGVPVKYTGIVARSGILEALSTATDPRTVLYLSRPTFIGTLSKVQHDRTQPVYATFRIKR